MALSPEDSDDAAEHFRGTSTLLKKEEIREAYKTLCNEIAAEYGLGQWSEMNTVTRMVTTNLGDTDAYDRAEQEEAVV